MTGRRRVTYPFSADRLNRCLEPISPNAVDQAHHPAVFVAVDRQRNLRFSWSMIDGSSENKEVRPEMGNRQDVTVYEQMHPNVS